MPELENVPKCLRKNEPELELHRGVGKEAFELIVVALIACAGVRVPWRMHAFSVVTGTPWSLSAAEGSTKELLKQCKAIRERRAPLATSVQSPKHSSKLTKE